MIGSEIEIARQHATEGLDNAPNLLATLLHMEEYANTLVGHLNLDKVDPAIYTQHLPAAITDFISWTVNENDAIRISALTKAASLSGFIPTEALGEEGDLKEATAIRAQDMLEQEKSPFNQMEILTIIERQKLNLPGEEDFSDRIIKHLDDILVSLGDDEEMIGKIYITYLKFISDWREKQETKAIS